MSYPSYALPELHFVGVADPGVPNLERLVLQPTQPLNLNGYGIAVGLDAGAQGARPIFDNCFWFPDLNVEPPSWVLVYTGRGVPRATQETGQLIHVLHWQRPHTIFDNRSVVPVLFRLDSTVIGQLL